MLKIIALGAPLVTLMSAGFSMALWEKEGGTAAIGIGLTFWSAFMVMVVAAADYAGK